MKSDMFGFAFGVRRRFMNRMCDKTKMKQEINNNIPGEGSGG